MIKFLIGQKMWLADDEEIPFLELRSLEFNQPPWPPDQSCPFPKIC